MSSEHNETHDFHEEKRSEIADEVEPFFTGGPVWKRPIFGVGIIWLVMTIIGVLIGLFAPVHLLSGESSSTAGSVKLTIIVFTVAAAPVAAVVYGIGLYSLFMWRGRKSGASDVPPADGPPIRGHGPASAIWLGISTILVVFLLFWGMSVLSSENTIQDDPIHVKVIGQQWQWTFQYGGTGVETTDLVLPVDRQIIFDVASKDVTHGFWPVQLGVQIDANPGFIVQIETVPNKLGQFDVRCSQLCGLNHSNMQTTGLVVTQKKFEHWLAKQGASDKSVTTYAAIQK